MFLGTLAIDERVGYLLMAEGLVEGNSESGHWWTGNGAEWAENVIEGAVSDRLGIPHG